MHVSLAKTYEQQNTPCSMIAACFAHQAMLKSLAVNAYASKTAKILKISNDILCRIYIR